MLHVTNWHLQCLVEAALDQPKPTPELRKALHVVLRDLNHEDRFKLEANPRKGYDR